MIGQSGRGRGDLAGQHVRSQRMVVHSPRRDSIDRRNFPISSCEFVATVLILPDPERAKKSSTLMEFDVDIAVRLILKEAVAITLRAIKGEAPISG
jgi:hypothetical protein